MSQRLVVVEDDRDLCTLLEYNLRKAGYGVTTLHRLSGAHATIRDQEPDLVLLDVMLPDGDGFEFCRQLRSSPSTAEIPILFLTALSQEGDRVLGLEIGGDDYITKPFSPRELLARIRAHLRRAERPNAPQRLSANGLSIDYAARKAHLNGARLPLTVTEFSLLGFFARNAGKAFTREQLIANVWGSGRHITPRNIDVHVRRLREQIESNPKQPVWIHTIRGFGYRFDIPE